MSKKILIPFLMFFSILVSILSSTLTHADVIVKGEDATAIQQVMSDVGFQGGLRRLLLLNCAPKISGMSVQADPATPTVKLFEIKTHCSGQSKTYKVCGIYNSDNSESGIIGCFNRAFTNLN